MLTSPQYIFIIYGSATFGMGLLILIALPDLPANAWFLTKEERPIAMRRVAVNQTGDASDKVIEACITHFVALC